jgi:hypothetical protein
MTSQAYPASPAFTETGVRLTARARNSLARRLLACTRFDEIDTLEREILATYAASPIERAVNSRELEWLQSVASMRRRRIGDE